MKRSLSQAGVEWKDVALGDAGSPEGDAADHHRPLSPVITTITATTAPLPLLLPSFFLLPLLPSF